MAKASDQFGQSDVVRWGIVAMVCGGIAIVAANLSAALPPSVLAGLHTSRTQGASVEQLRNGLVSLDAELARLRQENDTLTARFSQNEQLSGDAVRRIGALEVTLPRMSETLALRTGIDTSLPTASIDGTGAPLTPVEGGSMRVETRPLSLPGNPASQPLPAELFVPEAMAAIRSPEYGIALGSGVSEETAGAAWTDMLVKLGPLLLGLSPVLASGETNGNFRLVAGPTTDLGTATALCGRIERVAIACQPVPFTGTPLP